MIETKEYYGGTYPSPNEIYEEEDDYFGIEEDDYDCHMADVIYEERELGIYE